MILKATIAVVALLLTGCAGSSSEDVYAKYGYYDGAYILDEQEPDIEIVDDACKVNKCARKAVVAPVSVSYVAEPEMVPVKPNCKKKCAKKSNVVQKPETQVAVVEQSKAEQKNTAPVVLIADNIEVPQKPATPVVVPVVVKEKIAAADEGKEVVISTTEMEAKPVVVLPDKPLVTEEVIIKKESVQKNIEGITQEEKEWAQREAERMKAEEEEKLRLQQEAEQKKLEEEQKKLQVIAKQETESSLPVEQEEIIIDETLIQDADSIKTEENVNKEGVDDVKDWVASEGSTLRSLLMTWGDKAGWRIIWNMDRDYTLEASAIFRGEFVDVAAALLRSFARATPAPKGVFYKGNKVLVVSTREDENAD